MVLRYSNLLIIIVSGLFVVSCSKGPPPVRPGTPAFFWSAANEAYRTGDFVRTAENLAKAASTENEFTPRARAGLIVVSSGLTRGYCDIADAYENGARMNRTDPGAFRKQVSAQRTAAAWASLQAVETLHKFLDAYKEPTVPLAFNFPAGRLEDPAALGKLAKGILLAGVEAETVHRAMLQRGVVLSACEIAGAPENPARSAEIYQRGSVSRESFLAAVAQSMYDQTDLFGPKRLDQPRRVAVLCTEALEALSVIPSTREVKQLQRKIEATLKKTKIKAPS